MRNFRDKPFTWQEKNVLRYIQETFKNIKEAVSVYTILTQISSDLQTNEISTYGIKIMEMSGVGRDSLRAILNHLSEEGIIKLEKGKLTTTKNTVYGKMKIQLLTIKAGSQDSCQDKPQDKLSPPIEDNIESIIENNKNLLKENNNLKIENKKLKEELSKTQKTFGLTLTGTEKKRLINDYGLDVYEKNYEDADEWLKKKKKHQKSYNSFFRNWIKKGGYKKLVVEGKNNSPPEDKENFEDLRKLYPHIHTSKKNECKQAFDKVKGRCIGQIKLLNWELETKIQDPGYTKSFLNFLINHAPMTKVVSDCKLRDITFAIMDKPFNNENEKEKKKEQGMRFFKDMGLGYPNRFEKEWKEKNNGITLKFY